MTFNDKEYMRLYRENNKDKIKQYRENNKEKQKQYDKNRDLDNPDRYSERARKRRILNKTPMAIYELCQGPLCENEINHVRVDQKYCSKLCCNRAYKINKYLKDLKNAK